MIGESRDGETAEIAIKAAQLVTWCCLPYTLIPPAKRWYVTANGGRPLDAIIGAYAGNSQRLVRKLCPHCRRQQGEPIQFQTMYGHRRCPTGRHPVVYMLPRFLWSYGLI